MTGLLSTCGLQFQDWSAAYRLFSQVASYALLLLAAWRAGGGPSPTALPPPKWSASQKPQRTSTQRLLQQLRAEVWGHGLGLDRFSGFSSPPPAGAKPENLFSSLPSAVCYWTS